MALLFPPFLPLSLPQKTADAVMNERVVWGVKVGGIGAPTEPSYPSSLHSLALLFQPWTWPSCPDACKSPPSSPCLDWVSLPSRLHTPQGDSATLWSCTLSYPPEALSLVCNKTISLFSTSALSSDNSFSGAPHFLRSWQIHSKTLVNSQICNSHCGV